MRFTFEGGEGVADKIDEVEQKIMAFIDKATVGLSDSDAGEVYDLIKTNMVMKLEALEE